MRMINDWIKANIRNPVRYPTSRSPLETAVDRSRSSVPCDLSRKKLTAVRTNTKNITIVAISAGAASFRTDF